ncbi:MAG: glycoside hydrolase family 127 protein [Spirochaetales bacterium]|jgi:uncharacterized protein|nr:glycoside hydrolase family 127 protein [Spirochaetales bacterium]
MERNIKAIPHHNVDQTKGFWFDWFATNRDNTIESVYREFEKTGRIEAMKLNWKEGSPNKPHIFFDSDMAKWIESAAYVLHYRRNSELEAKIDAIIDLIEAGRDERGYFNSYFLQFEQDQRWQRRESHELYCAGHLLEAAIAYAEATGKKKFLDLMSDYMDYIHQIFFIEKSAAFNTPGHEEIELALMKLYRYGGEKKYFDLAAYFIDTRGQVDSQKAKPQELGFFKNFGAGYSQDQNPVTDQTDAQGHSVRFGYLYAAVADLARERGDDELFHACQRVLRDVTDRKMYVTGGVGNLSYGEAFGPSYILPNKEAYTETCASISLAMVYSRMLTMVPDGEYADLMELQLYNGALAGISFDGESFTYENPLEVLYRDVQFKEKVNAPVRPFARQKVFGCSCCPPNISRVLSSIGGYQYSASEETIYTHLYSSSKARIELASTLVTVEQQTDYPWNGDVNIYLSLEKEAEFTVALRIPGWSSSHQISLNGKVITPVMKKGYAYIHGMWHDRDRIQLSLPLEVIELESHPLIGEDAGKVAIKVGPLVYCAEERDNDERLWDYVIGKDVQYSLERRKDLLGGINTVTATVLMRDSSSEKQGLYRRWSPRYTERELILIPYYAWCNREPGNMTVWLRKQV